MAGDPSDFTKDLIDLERSAINSTCYLKWIGLGAAGGTLVKPVTGTVIGALGGLIWASMTCKPITDHVRPQASQGSRFITRSSLLAFQEKVSAVQPVSEEEALGLAVLAFKEGKISSNSGGQCSGAELNRGLAAVLDVMRGQSVTRSSRVA